jgi:hypothetical protein
VDRPSADESPGLLLKEKVFFKAGCGSHLWVALRYAELNPVRAGRVLGAACQEWVAV